MRKVELNEGAGEAAVQTALVDRMQPVRIDERVDDENCDEVYRDECPDGERLALRGPAGASRRGYSSAVRSASAT